jgi:DNA-binding winged helix-turn-helix (wHTH) protein
LSEGDEVGCFRAEGARHEIGGIITEEKRWLGAKSRSAAETRVLPPTSAYRKGSPRSDETEPDEAALFSGREILRGRVGTKRVSAGDITVDVERKEVRVANVAIGLTTLEFRILEALVRNAGRVLTRDFLTNIAMGRGLGAFGRSVDVHISNLRRKLGRMGALEQIKTVRGNGYMLAPRRALDGAGT